MPLLLFSPPIGAARTLRSEIKGSARLHAELERRSTSKGRIWFRRPRATTRRSAFCSRLTTAANIRECKRMT